MYNHQLDAFLQVADLGSFSKAAQAMYISPPAVIQQINLLEGRCGFKLFVRSNHGVTLTEAGRSLYQDAKAIVQFSQSALQRARCLVDASEHTIRVGTSLLFKCRLLPDIWARVSDQYSDLKIEILHMPEKASRADSIAALGQEHDLREGIYSSASLEGRCNFLELGRSPICCAVSRRHRLAGTQRLTLADLNGEYLVMPVEGASYELDAFRREIRQNHPTVQILDSSYYGADTFALCEVNPYILITQHVCSDIHSNLVTIPLETAYTLPYGLIYALDPTPATRKFIAAADSVRKSCILGAPGLLCQSYAP